jgi:hypothetical protein
VTVCVAFDFAIKTALEGLQASVTVRGAVWMRILWDGVKQPMQLQ